MSRCASGRSKPSGWNASSTPWCANSKVRATPRFRARTSANWSWKRCRHLIRLPISASPRSTAISGRRRISANLSGGSPRMTIEGGLAPATSLRDSTSTDLAMMRAALALARRGLGTTWPNPSVGCVIVNNGHVIGRGWTGRGGRPHGETEALRRAGAAARGASAYVTLEPCSHWGKTPPCADALIAAGLRRVVIALKDPDPRVAGTGIETLRKAGVAVEIGLCAAEAAELNAGFLQRVHLGRPLVTLKLATSLDGRIATASGESRWITGAPARERAHLLRATHDAILVGTDTVLADDPQLTCRLPSLADRSPVRIVIDRQLRIPPTARIIAEARQVPTWVVTLGSADPDRQKSLHDAGVEVIAIEPDAIGAIDLAAALGELGGRGLTRLLVEG